MLDMYLCEIGQRLDRGSALADVEAQVIEPASELSDDDRAVLWLFAWSYSNSPARAARPPERVVQRMLEPTISPLAHPGAPAARGSTRRPRQ